MFSAGSSQATLSLNQPFSYSLAPIGGQSSAYDPSLSPFDGLTTSNGASGHGQLPGFSSTGTNTGGGAAAILMRRLPRSTSYDSLRSMLLFAKHLVEVEFTANEYPEDGNFVSAVALFETRAAAEEARLMLHGKPNSSNEATMIVEVLSGSPGSSNFVSRRNTIDQMPASRLANRTQVTASGMPSLVGGRHTDLHQLNISSMDPSAVATNGATTTSTNPGLPAPDSGSGMHTLFSAQSGIGNGLSDRPRVSGKSVIDQDVDEDTNELLKDPVTYMNNPPPLTRRATNPHPLSAQMGGLSLATTNLMSPSIHPSFSAGSRSTATSASSATTAMSPGIPGLGRSGFNPQFHRPNYPAVNPADQNPPCNTLYVGNLPPDTSEDELKSLFSKQRGYKRMIFRNKANGPICFVEFEDVTFATKCLHDLYGYQLSNSVKGGIRLSFSKNPLGVRSGQPGSMHPANPMSSHNMMVVANGLGGMSGSRFSTASGPPPGLTLPKPTGPPPPYRPPTYFY
jgi:hypothetical protein